MKKRKVAQYLIIAILFFLPFSFASLAFSSCSYGGKTLSDGKAIYSSDGCDTCVKYCCPNGEMSSEDCYEDPDGIAYEEACEDKMSKCKSGYTEGSDGSCCLNTSKPIKTTAYLNYSSYGWDTTSGKINHFATLKVSAPYCKNSSWYVKLNSYSCTSPLSKTSDGCKMWPYWTCQRHNVATEHDGLQMCSGTASSVGALLDSYTSASAVYGAGSTGDCSYECLYRDSKRLNQLCECDMSLEDFETDVKSEYRASELKF